MKPHWLGAAVAALSQTLVGYVARTTDAMEAELTQ
jgi:hypothetical protein